MKNSLGLIFDFDREVKDDSGSLATSVCISLYKMF